MNEHNLDMDGFVRWMRLEERSESTVEKYLRDLRGLERWLGGGELNRDALIRWKKHLMDNGYSPVTINGMLATVNTYCRYAGLDIRARFLRIQRRLFREEEKNLTGVEYERLIDATRKLGRKRLGLLLETIGGTGMRVSEVKYVTVEGAKSGRIRICLKGKIRMILLPKKLCRKLLEYAKQQKIQTGQIFITRSRKAIGRKQIWAEMKGLCLTAKVAPSKVFPHNLRHLFAQMYYSHTKDVAKLADLLGHSSMETTRIYLVSSGVEQEKQINRLGLVS